MSSTYNSSKFLEARRKYHSVLLDSILTISNKGVPSNADKHSRLSVQIAQGIADTLRTSVGQRLAGQTSGSAFELANRDFLIDTFLSLKHLRPGNWSIKQIGLRQNAIAEYEQYSHLHALTLAAKENPELAAALGSDYTITPDVVIEHLLFEDEEINLHETLVSEDISTFASLRKANHGKPLLHASISSKWTIRSDRSQNSRSEALNLIRNRKGHLPHIVVVTGEPLPSRLASIALGTGDIDCVYHFALYELVDSVKGVSAEDAMELLRVMIDGKRLKDISDLPLDLAT